MRRLLEKFISLPIRAHMLLLALVVALPAAAMIVDSGLEVRQRAIAEAVAEIRKIGDDMAHDQAHAAQAAELLMTALVQLPDVKNRNPDKTHRLLADMLTLTSLFDNISVIDPTGTVWASAASSKPVFVGDRQYFRKAMATGRLASGEYVVSRITGQPAINFCYPYKDDGGAIAGAISISFRLDQLMQDLPNLESKNYSYTIVDQNGVVLAGRQHPAKAIGGKEVEAVFQQMQKGPREGSFVARGFGGGRERFMTYRKLYLKDEQTPYMYISTGIPYDAVMAQANRQLIRDLLIFALSLACAYLAAWHLAKRMIVNRVMALQSASRRLADGDLQARVMDGIKGGELGELGAAFDDMAQRLEERDFERRLAEHALRRSEARYRSLFDNSLFGIAAIGPGQRILRANEAFCSLLGYREAELVGRFVKEITHPEDLAVTLEQHRRLVQREIERFTLEKRYITKSGDVVNAISFVEATYGEDGRWDGNIACVLDITELKTSQERMQLFFERQIVGMAMYSPDKGWVQSNPRLQQMLGYSQQEMAGMPWTKFTHPADLRRESANLEKLNSGQINDFSLEKRMIRKDGSELVGEISVSCVRKHDGAVDYYLVVVNDVTERKQVEAEIGLLHASLEQRVQERTAQLEAAIREQESFSYSVSHDLRSPLRHINSYLGMLQEDCGHSLPHEAQYFMNRARAASVKMGKLIDDLLELSRVSRSKLVKEPVDLSRLASSIVTRLQETEPERTAEVVIEPDLKAMGDKVLMGLVLENLLGNAWKYTSRKECARLVFGAREGKGPTSFFVKDNGAGFDMAYQDKLFGAFQRLHGDEYDGTGIGLATVKRIMERHGGEVWAEGEVGAGATFYFSLP